MASVRTRKGTLSLTAYRGDAKTLLAFNLDKASTTNCAGFTIQCKPKGQQVYYLHNQLQFKTPSQHAQDPKEPPNSTINAPIHKFRWVHVPGSVHQGLQPFLGPYTYTVTPRYFDATHSLIPLDKSLSASVQIDVTPFKKSNLELAFTRGFIQSQAFVNHFGKDALIRPKGNTLLFDTSQYAGTNAQGDKFTFEDEYEWMGFTARDQIFALLDEVAKDKTLRLDMFAYDLNEPDLARTLLTLAGQGRIRIILDNSTDHHNAKTPKPEDQFEVQFNKARKGNSAILRGKFGRYSHDKVFIVSKAGTPVKALTGSTNFSVTGLYVNSNHVLVFNDSKVAQVYADVFEESWNDKTSQASFQKSALATKTFQFKSAKTPKTEITFAPHDKSYAATVLDAIVSRIQQEGQKTKATGNVLFAVMEIDNGVSPVWTALKALHANESIFSFGISDSQSGIQLYAPGHKTGVLVTGKPSNTVLPPPFNQVPGITIGHQVHHKFVVCGFNRADAVVYCGSSNLASGGEEANGDNLLAIYDRDVATAFAIEAVSLVDHFNFLDKYATGPKNKKKKPSASPKDAAVLAGWFLSTSDHWVKPYFDPKDLHCADRELFG